MCNKVNICAVIWFEISFKSILILLKSFLKKCLIINYKDAQLQDITEKTVLYHVHRTAKKLTVTSLTERVWVALLDTQVQIVLNVSSYIYIIFERFEVKVSFDFSRFLCFLCFFKQ